jgi:hypothetical protein
MGFDSMDAVSIVKTGKKMVEIERAVSYRMMLVRAPVIVVEVELHNILSKAVQPFVDRYFREKITVSRIETDSEIF